MAWLSLAVITLVAHSLAVGYICDLMAKLTCAPEKPLTREQQKMVTAHLGIAVTVICRLGIPRGQQWEEARAEAQFHLARAATSYDSTKGSFSTWAWWKVNGGCKDWLKRENRARRWGITVVSMAEEDSVNELEWEGLSPEDDAADDEMIDLIRESLEGNSPLVKKLVARMVLIGLTKAECTKLAKVKAAATGRLLQEAQVELAWLRDSLCDRDGASR